MKRRCVKTPNAPLTVEKGCTGFPLLTVTADAHRPDTWLCVRDETA